MSEEFKDENISAPPPAEENAVVLIKKLQQQLTFLEKKVDILINQSQAAPAGERHFSKPYRSFDRSERHGRGERDSGFRERGPSHGRPFEKRHGEEHRGFGYKKKHYDESREGDSGRERHFEKRHNDENRGFRHKKKPFFYGRRDRG